MPPVQVGTAGRLRAARVVAALASLIAGPSVPQLEQHTADDEFEIRLYITVSDAVDGDYEYAVTHSLPCYPEAETLRQLAQESRDVFKLIFEVEPGSSAVRIWRGSQDVLLDYE